MKENMKKNYGGVRKVAKPRGPKTINLLTLKERFLWLWLDGRSELTERQKSELGSVCLFLGPYRNLTTLTSAMLFLHPHCQVMNHGSRRITDRRKLNFFMDYSERKFDKFCQYMIFASQRGMSGGYGGSIAYSHAFSHPEMKMTYTGRYGTSLLKDRIRCIAWKEPRFISNHIRDNNVDLKGIFRKNAKLRFLLPVRNPIDCAVSNHRVGRAWKPIAERNGQEYTVEYVLEKIMLEFKWFLDLRKEHPGRFFYFFQDELNKDMLVRLAGFLDLEPERRWIEDSLGCLKVKGGYDHKPEWVEAFERLQEVFLKDHPEFRARLAGMAPAGKA